MAIMISRSPKVQDRSTMSIDVAYIDKLKRMIPLLIDNYDDSSLHVNNPALVESQQADLTEYELGSNQSVSDKQLTLTREHLRRAALDCITAIVDGVGYANVRNVMKPIVEYVNFFKISVRLLANYSTFDSKNFWVPCTFPKIIMRMIIRSNFVRLLSCSYKLLIQKRHNTVMWQ